MPPEEQIIFEGKIPFRVVHFSHSLRWLLLLGWNIGLLVSWVQMLGETIKITSQRVVLAYGILSQEMEEVEYYRVKDTRYQQGVLQRLVGIGTILLFSHDPTAPLLAFTMTRPEHYREQIRRCVNVERKRMGAILVE
jgi:membrane protein YdbS with pleckstrin-like domain